MKLLLIEDDPIVHEGMMVSFTARGIELCLTATLAEALHQLAQNQPHAIILDLVLLDPITNKPNYHKPFGLEAARILSQQYPHIPLLIYSNQVQHMSELDSLLQAHGAGAGYLNKGMGVPRLLEFLESIIAGEKRYDSGGYQAQQSNGRPPPSIPLSPEIQPYWQYALEHFGELTELELVTCKWAAEGFANSKIAQQLYVSPDTIHQRFAAIYKKLRFTRKEMDNKSFDPRALLLALYRHLRDLGKLPPH